MSVTDMIKEFRIVIKLLEKTGELAYYYIYGIAGLIKDTKKQKRSDVNGKFQPNLHIAGAGNELDRKRKDDTEDRHNRNDQT